MAAKKFAFKKDLDGMNGIVARQKRENKLDGKTYLVEKYESGLFQCVEYYGYDKVAKQHLEGPRVVKATKDDLNSFFGNKVII